ncbi:lichenan operon transcriptional antiterminator [Lactobacillus colini]|uniref:Lichenan operon transcriptional antiterminator n=1 Tax=Lactobacillus colini TaxID=1819254 RepID=A0ABS4MEV3_9LACO|nr:PTS sugar transporter subunit IIA [Lactobacillus colini]MBP2058224.1 lichenan operon transcriptional antiterminator [Lactobacillus colini]
MLEKEIIEKLKKSEDYLSSAYLAKELNVSKRTIQNRLKNLNKDGNKFGFKIKNIYSKGYYLDIVNQDKFIDYYKSQSKFEMVRDSTQIMIDEIHLLLLAGNDFITVNQISNYLNLSPTTIFSKLQRLENYLSTYKLELLRKSHYGIKIVGEKKDIIQLIADLYGRKSNIIVEDVDSSTGNIEWIRNEIEDVFRRRNAYINYYQYQNLLDWIKSLIFYKKHFRDKKRKIFISKNDEYQNLLLKIYDYYQLGFQEDESNLFHTKIADIAFERKAENSLDIDNIEVNLKKFIKEIDIKGHTSLSDDDEFISKLSRHINLLFQRINKNIDCKNPLLMEISVKYPDIFDIALQLSTFLKRKFKYEISNDELGFIALHFLNSIENRKKDKLGKYRNVAVICTSGGGVSELTKTRLLSILPKSKIVAFSFYDTQKIEEFNPDLVFTMVSLLKGYDVPTIFINELLSKKDLEDIKEILFLDDVPSTKTTFKKNNNSWLKFFRSDLISKYNNQTYFEILKRMSAKLQDKNYVDTNFVNNVLKREEYMSTVYKNGFAIPHPIKMDANKSSIFVGIPTQKVKVNEKEVKLIFLVSLRQEDLPYYSVISDSLYNLMNDKEKMELIIKTPDIKQIQKILKDIGE